MGRNIDYDAAKRLLNEAYEEALKAFQTGEVVKIDGHLESAADTIFTTTVQSYREALLGCALAKVLDPEIDVTLPYKNQGPNAFSARSLDEKVVNPFLVSRSIPCSRGPYLATFRRNIRFGPETRDGLRDKEGYDAFLVYLDALREADPTRAYELFRYLLFRFVKLRYESEVELQAPSTLTLENWRKLIQGLIDRESGGLFPVLITVAYLRTLVKLYRLPWEISWQPINVSDRAANAPGDIVVKHEEQVYMAFEVTERRIDRSRVEATFRTKIARKPISDYLFVFAKEEPEAGAFGLARELLTLGTEVNFVHVRDFVINGLAVGGVKARRVFRDELMTLLRHIPPRFRHMWNDEVEGLLHDLKT